MNSEEITDILSIIFTPSTVENISPDSWQVNDPKFNLLVIISEDGQWLRSLIPIARASEAKPYLEQLMSANFDATQLVRYALHQEVLWAVFHHKLESLTQEDFQEAIASLVSLHEIGLIDYFNQFTEQKIRQIIKIAKMQGQTKESTLQSLNRLYFEGMLGGIEQDSVEREKFLKAWEYQLQRLWDEE